MILRRIARIKSVLTRFNFYGNLLQLVLLVSLNGLRWWYLFVPPIAIALYFFETKVGIIGEMDVAWQRSDDWKNFLDRFERIERKILETR